MIQRILKEPAIASVVMKLLALLAASYGVQVSYETLMEVSIALDILLALFVRQSSTPNVKVQEKIRASTIPPGTIVGLTLLALLPFAQGCAEPTAAGALCRTRANAKWALEAERLCPDTPAPAEQDWDQCQHRQSILDGLQLDLDGCPL